MKDYYIYDLADALLIFKEIDLSIGKVDLIFSVDGSNRGTSWLDSNTLRNLTKIRDLSEQRMKKCLNRLFR